MWTVKKVPSFTSIFDPIFINIAVIYANHTCNKQEHAWTLFKVNFNSFSVIISKHLNQLLLYLIPICCLKDKLKIYFFFYPEFELSFMLVIRLGVVLLQHSRQLSQLFFHLGQTPIVRAKLGYRLNSWHPLRISNQSFDVIYEYANLQTAIFCTFKYQTYYNIKLVLGLLFLHHLLTALPWAECWSCSAPGLFILFSFVGYLCLAKTCSCYLWCLFTKSCWT